MVESKADGINYFAIYFLKQNGSIWQMCTEGSGSRMHISDLLVLCGGI